MRDVSLWRSIEPSCADPFSKCGYLFGLTVLVMHDTRQNRLLVALVMLAVTIDILHLYAASRVPIHLLTGKG